MTKENVMFSKNSNDKKNRSKGATMVEYAVLVSLIAVLSIVSVNAIGLWISNTFDRTSCEMTNTCP